MKKINRYSLIAASLAAGFALGGSARGQTSDASLNALVKKGILTEQEAKDALADQQMKSGLTNMIVRPRGNESKLLLEGFLQANTELGDAASFEGKLTGGPNQVDPRIRLRRARIGVMGDFYDDFDFKLEGDFSQNDGTSPGNRSDFSATDIYINYHKFAEMNLRVGQFFAPFGYEMLIPDVGPGQVLLSAERSLVTIATVPERQVGAMLWGQPLATIAPDQASLLNYQIGAFNGDGRNVLTNDNSKFMYVGRIESVPYSGKFFGQDVKWRLGANALYTVDSTGTVIDPIGNFKVNTTDGSLGTFTVPAPDERIGWGLDQTITIGPFDLTAEYLEMHVRPYTPTKAFPEFYANGYYVQPSLFVWGNKLQLVAKYESFNPGQNISNDNITSMTGGLNYYIHGKNVIAMLDYIHTWSEYRQDHPADGKDQFNEVLLRLEFYF